MRIQQLDNARVLFERNSSRIINIQIWTDVGSSDEESGEFGAAHFLEHMFFKGTPSRDAKKINHDADRIGAKLNAWTWHDYTNYHLSVMRENFEKGFELLSDIYCNALFPEEEMEKERTVILSEIRRYEDDPPVYLSDLALEHYCENGLGHRVTGTVESVGQLTRSQLVAFKQNFYGGKNVMISVAGDISFETVRGVVEKHFHSPARSHPVTHVPGDYRSGNFDLTRPDIQESQYQLYFPALPFRHPRAIDQAVMAYVLGGNSSSLLFERIREELGLCYGIYARVNHFEGFNYLDVSTGCAEKDLEKLDREVMRIIERLTETNIEPERLEMTKTAMLSTLYMATESSSGLNTFLSMAVMRGEREENILEKRADQIKAVTAESIRESARETFSRPSLRARLTPT